MTVLSFWITFFSLTFYRVCIFSAYLENVIRYVIKLLKEQSHILENVKTTMDEFDINFTLVCSAVRYCRSSQTMFRPAAVTLQPPTYVGSLVFNYRNISNSDIVIFRSRCILELLYISTDCCWKQQLHTASEKRCLYNELVWWLVYMITGQMIQYKNTALKYCKWKTFCASIVCGDLTYLPLL